MCSRRKVHLFFALEFKSCFELLLDDLADRQTGGHVEHIFFIRFFLFCRCFALGSRSPKFLLRAKGLPHGAAMAPKIRRRSACSSADATVAISDSMLVASSTAQQIEVAEATKMHKSRVGSVPSETVVFIYCWNKFSNLASSWLNLASSRFQVGSTWPHFALKMAQHRPKM